MALTVVLTEHALRSRDVARIVQLHASAEQTTYLVLVPASRETPSAIEAINRLTLGDLREAWAALTESDDPQAERAEAIAALEESLDLFEQTGAQVSGSLTPADPLPALASLAEQGADQVIVVTEPQAVQDVLGRDWASQAERDLEVPVLHFYSGTDHVA